MLGWIWLIPLFPFAGFLVLAVGKRLPQRLAAAIGTGSIGLSFAGSAVASGIFAGFPPVGNSFTLTLWEWVRVGGFSPAVSLTLDALSAVMILVVTGIGFLIHLYSARFMAKEEGYHTFFAYMNLFVGAMLILVLASNLLLLYLGWEGVGLCSFLLIGFWYRDPENGRAARKAFIVTRVGDVSLAVGLFIIATSLGSLEIQDITRRAVSAWPAGSAIAVAAAALLLGGAVGKSAQLPLHTWLPDAMAGPTPVSALIHAATMVTAGVYLIARMHALFTLAPAVLLAIAIIGAAGILFAGASAVTQRNIKRVLAYSTMSQLGYMFLALGVGAWSGAIFHLVTHAFFKSLLFLCAGVVILACDHEHDIFAMGGLRKRMPYTFWIFLIAACTIAAIVPTTAGFTSKDLILLLVWQSGSAGPYLWAVALLGAFVTSMYIFRLVFLVFTGKPAGEPRGKGHADGPDGMRAGVLMGAVLAVLAFLCFAGGFLDLPRYLGGKPFLADFLRTALPAEVRPLQSHPGTEALLQVFAEIAGLAGVPFAWLLARRARRAAPALAGNASHAGLGPRTANPIVRFLFSGWGFDWAYDRIFVRPLGWVARINAKDIVDRFFDGVGGASMLLSRGLRGTQNGRLRWYAACLAAGAALVIAAVVLL
jgi:NADH-quinone oxidoreductase subunit L